MKNPKGKSRDRHTGEGRYPELFKTTGFPRIAVRGRLHVKPGMTNGGRYAFLRVHQQGFTLIELLIVVSIIGLMMTVTLPVSVNMYYRYKASLQAQEVMVAISDLRRESFLYSENKILSSNNDTMTVNGEAIIFADTRIRIDVPIEFYKNGTTSGGVINLLVGEHAFALHVKAPLGDLSLEGGARAA